MLPESLAPYSYVLNAILNWFLFSVGFWLLSGKLKWKRRFHAWIPGLCYIELGRSLDMEQEGLVCCVLDLILSAVGLMNPVWLSDRLQTGVGLVMLIMMVFLYVYGVRLCLRLLTVFRTKKFWVVLWFFVPWLILIVLGAAPSLQPQEIKDTREENLAGTTPAVIPGVTEYRQSLTPAESGLSIDLEERVARDYSKKRYLLKDISLDIPNGSLVMLLGGSGSGKTTFINAVIGYEKANARMVLNGGDIYKDYARMKYRIGFVPQQNLIRGSDTVERTVGDAAKLRMSADATYEKREKKIDEVMDLLGLTAGRDGLVSKKSGGQLRRISIAMELVSDPELFVLDEPDSGLDGVIARELFTKLRGIADEGKIVIAITHTPDRVIDLFDKVIVLARDSGRVGRLAFYGTPQEAREFFGKDSMEGIVMSVNRKEEGGEGMADYYIERYARLHPAAEEEGAVS